MSGLPNIPLLSMGVKSKVAQPRARQASGEPHSQHLGDIEVPWNVGKTIFRYKAARNMVVADAALVCKEVVSPTGKRVRVEAWLNGKYLGEQPLKHGPNAIQGNAPLKQYDEIEMRIVVRGEQGEEQPTFVKDAWAVFTTR